MPHSWHVSGVHPNPVPRKATCTVAVRPFATWLQQRRIGGITTAGIGWRCSLQGKSRVDAAKSMHESSIGVAAQRTQAIHSVICVGAGGQGLSHLARFCLASRSGWLILSSLSVRRWRDGHCPYGDTCKYAHGDGDLRPAAMDGGKGRGGAGKNDAAVRDERGLEGNGWRWAPQGRGWDGYAQRML